MARINIEDQFWLDILDIIGSYGSQDEAIGNAVRFIRFAQEKHKQGLLISERDFEVKGFSEALIPLFAERVDGGIRAAGAAKHFGWLLDKSESGRVGGKKSAGRPRDGRGRLLPLGDNDSKQIQAPSKQDQADPSSPSTAKHKPSTAKLHQASPSPSPSPSYSLSVLKKESTKEPSSVGEEGESEGIPAAPEDEIDFGLGKPVRERFEVLDPFKDEPDLSEVLCFISSAVQRNWAARYDHEWIKAALRNAIQHHLAKENASESSQINDWGVRLVKWVRNDKKPRLKANTKSERQMIEEFEAELQKSGEVNHER